MTKLADFLTSLYDSFSDAELQALRHGHTRLEEVLEDEAMPGDVAVPVYHASDAQVTLDVGLVAEETDAGLEVFVTEDADTDASELGFTVDLFELVEREDLEAPAENAGTEEDGPRKDNGGQTPPIEVIEEIDPEYVEVLWQVGIRRLSDLIERSPEEIAEVIDSEDVEVSPQEAAGWLDEARGLESILAERETAMPVELVNGIGPTFGRRLRQHEMGDLSDLADSTPAEVAEIVSTGEVTVSPERTATWLERATETLDAMAELSEGEYESGSSGSTDESVARTERSRTDDGPSANRPFDSETRDETNE